MLPILKFGNLAIPTYGVIGLFAFLFTLWLIKYYAVKEDFDYRKARDMYLYAVAASLIGAKFLGIIIEMPTIIQNPGYLWKA